MDRVDELDAVDPLQVDRGDAEVGVPELALDDDQWHALMRHLDRVRVTQLMRREPPPDTAFPSVRASCLRADDDSHCRPAFRVRSTEGWIRRATVRPRQSASRNPQARGPAPVRRPPFTSRRDRY